MLNQQNSRFQTCRNALRDLGDSVRARIEHCQKLPGRIRVALEYAERTVATPDVAIDSREVARQIATVLHPYARYDELPHDVARSLVGDINILGQFARSLPSDETFAVLLHNTIEQHVEVAAAGIDDLAEGIKTATAELRGSLPDGIGEGLAIRILSAFELCCGNNFKPSELVELENSLRDAVFALPSASPQSILSGVGRYKSSSYRSRYFRIVIVEDEEAWQNFTLHAIASVRNELGTDFRIETDCFDNVEAALSAILSETEKNKHDPSRPQTIVVLDMGLPASAADAQAAGKDPTIPRRSNGHILLQQLRTYSANVPVIILTTPPHLLEDQRRACERGVKDVDYILKELGKQHRLVEAILRLIEIEEGHKIELWLSPQHRANIDGVPIELEDMEFHTLYALCELSKNTSSVYTTRQILDQLAYTFRDEYDYRRPPETEFERARVLARQRSGDCWAARQASSIANVIHLWAARKRDAAGDRYKSLRLFRENFWIWKEANALFDAYRRGHPDRDGWAERSNLSVDRWDERSLADGFEEAFGGLQIDDTADYNLHNIQNHVLEIRKAIHNAFNSVHRFIEPREEILVTRTINDREGYRMLGEIVFCNSDQSFIDNEADADNGDEGSARSDLRQVRVYTVLVVENEEVYRERIRTLLEGFGFHVRVATNVEDAIAEIRGLQRPDILCLDLHIPNTQREFDRDPSSGDVFGGLRVLQCGREELQNGDLRVVIPTTHYDQDKLREQAAVLGVPVSNFVRKGIAGWESELLVTTKRLRDEIWSRAVLPALPPWKYPIVRIANGSDLSAGRLHLIVNGRACPVIKGRQGRLLSELLQHRGEMLSYHDLGTVVYGQKANVQQRKQLLKYVRAKIRKDWMGLSEDAHEHPERDILESCEGGLTIHCYLDGSGSHEGDLHRP